MIATATARRSLSVLAPAVSTTNGAIIYRGPSLLDGSPIVAVATGLRRRSANEKTGGLVQTYILVDNVRPLEALRSGADAAVCGDCPHREGSCYVNVGQGPTAVAAAVARGSYPDHTGEDLGPLGADRVVRLGTYGDPAAVPLAVWESLLSKSRGHTGYTHQWRKLTATGLGRFCMASVETADDRRAATAAGWRTFRIRRSLSSPLLPGEIVCPTSEEGGYRKTCESCRACNGGRPPRASVVIVGHGLDRKVKKLAKLID